MQRTVRLVRLLTQAWAAAGGTRINGAPGEAEVWLFAPGFAHQRWLRQMIVKMTQAPVIIRSWHARARFRYKRLSIKAQGEQVGTRVHSHAVMSHYQSEPGRRGGVRVGRMECAGGAKGTCCTVVFTVVFW